MDIRQFEDTRWSNSTQKAEFRHHAATALADGEAVLDVGCGSGTLLAMLKERGFSVTGADISEVAVSRCREQGFTATHLTSGTELPFDDDSFDTVMALDVLEHLYDPSLLLKELKRVSRGSIIIGVPNFSSFPARLQVLFGRVPENNRPHKGHLYWFNLSVLKKLLAREGLSVTGMMTNTVWESVPLLGTVLRALKILMPGLFALSFVVRTRPPGTRHE